MTITDIQQIVSKGETRTLELKKTTGELRRGMELTDKPTGKSQKYRTIE